MHSFSFITRRVRCRTIIFHRLNRSKIIVHRFTYTRRVTGDLHLVHGTIPFLSILEPLLSAVGSAELWYLIALRAEYVCAVSLLRLAH